MDTTRIPDDPNNIILKMVREMIADGWHPNGVSAVRDDDNKWWMEIWVDDNVAMSDVGVLNPCGPRVVGPPPGPLGGTPGVSVEIWCCRPNALRQPLPAESWDVYEMWIAEVARAGRAPDWCYLNGTRYLTKPIIWLRDPVLIAALLRKYPNETRRVKAHKVRQNAKRGR